MSHGTDTQAPQHGAAQQKEQPEAHAQRNAIGNASNDATAASEWIVSRFDRLALNRLASLRCKEPQLAVISVDDDDEPTLPGYELSSSMQMGALKSANDVWLSRYMNDQSLLPLPTRTKMKTCSPGRTCRRSGRTSSAWLLHLQP